MRYKAKNDWERKSVLGMCALFVSVTYPPSFLDKCWEQSKSAELELYCFKDKYNIIRITDTADPENRFGDLKY